MKISNKNLLVATIATVLSSGVVQGSAFPDTTDSSTRRPMGISKAAISDGKMYVDSKILSEDKDGVLELAPQASQIQFDLWGTNPFLKDVKFGKDAQVSINCDTKSIPEVITLINDNAEQNISLSLALDGYASSEELKTLVQPLSQLPSVSLLVYVGLLEAHMDIDINSLFLKDELEKIGKSVNLLNGNKKSISDSQLNNLKVGLEEYRKECRKITSDKLADFPKKALRLATDIHVDSIPGHDDAMNSFLVEVNLKNKTIVSMNLNPGNIHAFITFIENNKDLITSLKILLRDDIPLDELRALARPLSQLPSVILAVDEISLDSRKQANRNAIFLKDELEKIGKSVQLENDRKKLITPVQLARIRDSLRSKD